MWAMWRSWLSWIRIDLRAAKDYMALILVSRLEEIRNLKLIPVCMPSIAARMLTCDSIILWVYLRIPILIQILGREQIMTTAARVRVYLISHFFYEDSEVDCNEW